MVADLFVSIIYLFIGEGEAGEVQEREKRTADLLSMYRHLAPFNMPQSNNMR